MHRQKGFSLIELLIVVAIILIIAAIAIPNLMKSRMQANEASAVASLRVINNAQISYITQYPSTGYADVLSKLGPTNGATPTPTKAGFLDDNLGCASQPCTKSGYNFAIVNPRFSPVASYELTAVPVIVNSTGHRGFCSSELIVITQDPAGGTSCTTPIK
jgi:prepilin-type N-terminal cleavage/methylation domain-containing protein